MLPSGVGIGSCWRMVGTSTHSSIRFVIFSQTNSSCMNASASKHTISYKKLPKLVVQLIDWQKKKLLGVSFSYSTLLKKIANAHICRRLFIYLLFSLIVVIVLGKYIGSSSTQ